MTKSRIGEPASPSGAAPPSAAPNRSPADWAARLRAIGHRATPQRLIILGAFRPGEHVSADEILARVAPTVPGVNRSTIYRALELFRDLGLVSETDLGGGVRHFELIDDRHHHLICRHCGDVLELGDQLVAPLRAAIAEHHGFDAGIEHLAIFGLCRHCREAAPALLPADPAR